MKSDRHREEIDARPDYGAITLSGMTVRTIIGVLDEERHQPRDVVLHLVLTVDSQRAAARDDLADTVDYAAVAERVVAFVESSRFHLIETLAERVAQLILAEFAARVVTVSVEKPGAVQGVATVAVSVTRSRSRE